MTDYLIESTEVALYVVSAATYQDAIAVLEDAYENNTEDEHLLDRSPVGDYAQALDSDDVADLDTGLWFSSGHHEDPAAERERFRAAVEERMAQIRKENGE